MVSSRLRPRKQWLGRWLPAFRAFCERLDANGETFFRAARTPADPFVAWAVERYRLTSVRLVEPRARRTQDQWRLELPAADPQPAAGVFEAHVSPASQPEQGSGGERWLSSAPLRDRCLVAAADRLIVLHIRPGGHLERLIRARAAVAPPRLNAAIELAGGNSLIPSGLQKELKAAGCQVTSVGGRGQIRGRRAAPRVGSARSAVQRAAAAPRGSPVMMPPADPNWSFLSHWTRAPGGAWPDQTQVDYIGGLVLGTAKVDPTPLDTLFRIVQQQRLLANSAAIRGLLPVVCFTELHPRRFLEQRVFRAHRNRWDFEPYGISIRAAWLRRRGARRVIYGDDETWRNLPAEDRGFFQRNSTSGKRGRCRIDWQGEREWRHAGDIDLSQLGPSDGLLFVPSIAEAERLVSISRWPVAVVRSS